MKAAVCENKTGDSSSRRGVHEIIQKISCKICLCIKSSCSGSVLSVWGICIEASFLLRGCFLLLVAHILGSVVQLNLNGRILGQRGKEQEKRPPLISELTWSFLKEAMTEQTVLTGQVLGSTLSSLLCWNSALQPHGSLRPLKSLRKSSKDQESPCMLLLPDLGQISFRQGQVQILNTTPLHGGVWAVLPVQLELSLYFPPALPVWDVLCFRSSLAPVPLLCWAEE